MNPLSGRTEQRHRIRLLPHVRAWFDRERAWHGEKVRIHGRSRFIADGTEVSVDLYLSDGAARKGAKLDSLSGKLEGGRLLGPDGGKGVEHELAWRIRAADLESPGIHAELRVPSYEVSALSPLLLVDLDPFRFSE